MLVFKADCTEQHIYKRQYFNSCERFIGSVLLLISIIGLYKTCLL
ncbi:MAG: hypothetical protein OFPI_39480 [Osedax symbiont Rs2]|nr:MAG: hypothetical protein OFPI_39480 [Osedax symbiont Rs2]